MTPSPLWLVPGLGLGREAWEPTLAALRHFQASASVHRVVLLPGFGKPGRGVDLSPTASAQRLGHALSRHATEPVVLVGHSASCQLVTHLAAHSPDAVRALILVGPTTDPGAASWPRLLGRWLRTAAFEPWWQLPLLARQYARTGAWTMLRAMDSARRDTIDVPLRTVSCPVLIVRGAHDRIAPRRWVDTLAALPRRPHPEDGMAGATVISLDSGAHMVPLTRPRLLAAEISRFLTEGGTGIETGERQ